MKENKTFEYADEHLYDNDYDQWLNETLATRPLPEPRDANDFVF